MKLIYAIVRDNDADNVVRELTKNRFSVTRLATSGGFLKKGNMTLLVGTEDDRVDEVIDIVKLKCGKHQKLTVNMPAITEASMVNYATVPVTVEVGGATIFVVDVARCEKI